MVTIEVEKTIANLLADLRDEYPDFTCSEIIGAMQILSFKQDMTAACQEAKRRLEVEEL